MAQNAPFTMRYILNYLALILMLLSVVSVAVNSASAVDTNVMNKDAVKRNAEPSKSNKIKEDIKPQTTTGSTPIKTTVKVDTVTVNATSKGKVDNCTDPSNCQQDDFLRNMFDNRAMLFRTMMVLLGVTSIVILYFIVRAVRLRRRRSKSRKYGVITKAGENTDMEMEPLGDGNDDDEDYTVFEMNGRRK